MSAGDMQALDKQARGPASTGTSHVRADREDWVLLQVSVNQATIVCGVKRGRGLAALTDGAFQCVEL